MNALLVITIVMLQDDGAVTRQQNMVTFPSIEACREEMARQKEALSSPSGPVIGARIECHEMATLEVIRPAPDKAPEKPAVKLPTGPGNRS